MFEVILYREFIRPMVVMIKYEKIIKYLRKLHKTRKLVPDPYRDHLIKSIMIVTIHILLMKFLYIYFRMKNNTTEVVAMIELIGSFLAVKKMLITLLKNN